eukprot:148123-Amorphochlora_amoeboformis.AAC.4
MKYMYEIPGTKYFASIAGQRTILMCISVDLCAWVMCVSVAPVEFYAYGKALEHDWPSARQEDSDAIPPIDVKYRYIVCVYM